MQKAEVTYDHPAAWPSERLLEDCAFRRQRRSGPGGQHRNKVETAVVFEHTPSGIRGEASERRSQAENRAQALQRLRVNLALKVRGPSASPGLPAEPSELWMRRAKGGKVTCNPDHSDFPALLAEALDALAVSLPDPAPAADHLGVSASQFVKFLALEPRALADLNAARARAGLHRLR